MARSTLNQFLLGVGLACTSLIWTVSGQSAQVASPAPTRTQATVTAPVDPRALVDQYCVTCHNDRTRTAGLSLQGRAVQAGEAAVWEKVVRKVSAGQMPPVGMPRPDAAVTRRFVTSLETSLDGFAAARPNPGGPILHRLNRAEYANAVRDLLAVDIDAAALLPADESSNGFDNIADALGLSPVLLERYLAAADRISALAVGDAPSRPVAQTWVARGDSHQLDHIDGLPLGTRGGLLIRDTIPADGEYQISAKLYRTNNGFTRGLSAPHEVEFNVDGERVYLTSVGGQEDWMGLLTAPGTGADKVDAKLQARVTLKAGPRRVGVTFVAKSGARNQAFFRPLTNTTDVVDSDGVPRIDAVTITGPFTVTGPGDTPSRQRLFTCRPSASMSERACATTIARRLARAAYRRPAREADVTELLKYFDEGRKRRGTFDGGVQMVVRRVLADPAFLFRAEPEPAGAAAGAAYRLGDLETASNLSFFLWSSIPDEQLLRVAESGRLRDRAVFATQVRRMLADPKSSALVSNFVGQWLQLRNLQRVSPDPMKYPDFDDNLRQAFRRETELLVDSILREDRSVVDLLRADYTFVNERLARHYGIPAVTGSHFRRVAVTSEARKGLLGHGSILTVTSHPNRTSPVKRGKWVLEQLLGSPPPPPPPNVPPLDESASRSRPRTMKERMEEHRRNPTCANCHRLMDPVGLALENFDGVGTWRVRDAGVRIDTTTQLSDGTAVANVVDLRAALVARSDVFVRTFTENLMTYALGRGLAADDMPAVRTVLRGAAAQDYRISAIINGIVTSAPFRMRVKGAAATLAAE
jgi:mono/diheme cytochrome c family protein